MITQKTTSTQASASLAAALHEQGKVQYDDAAFEAEMRRQQREHDEEMASEPQVAWQEQGWSSSDDGLSESKKCVVRYPDGTFISSLMTSERGGEPVLESIGVPRSSFAEAKADAESKGKVQIICNASEQEEAVQDVVNDVLERALRHNFQPDEDMVRGAVEESANLLNIELSEQQVAEACSRILDQGSVQESEADAHEIIVKLADGCTLRSGVDDPGAEGALTAGDYVRLCDPDGEEIHFWSKEEWETDPALVMGAIMIAAAGNRLQPSVEIGESVSPGM